MKELILMSIVSFFFSWLPAAGLYGMMNKSMLLPKGDIGSKNIKYQGRKAFYRGLLIFLGGMIFPLMIILFAPISLYEDKNISILTTRIVTIVSFFSGGIVGYYLNHYNITKTNK